MRYIVLALACATAIASKDVERVDLKRNGAFGFPQVQAQVLCNQKDLRVSAWSDAKHLYVQAILWTDNDDTVGETEDGRKIGDWSNLCLDLDADQKDTPQVDRVYSLNPWPTLPGLRYQVLLGNGGSTGLHANSKGRGAIRYLTTSEGTRVRVDNFVLPLAELGKKPGDEIRVAYWGSSVKPALTVNSVGFQAASGKYYGFSLPKNKYHSIRLSDRAASLETASLPEGREDTVALPTREVKPIPKEGAVPPEVVAKEWINLEKPARLVDLHGKVVLVEFWATWCGPCVAGIPHLNALHAKHGPNGLQILSFTDQSKQGIENFLTKTPIKYPIGTGSDLAAEYGVTGIPHAFLIGKDGKLLWQGHPSAEELEKRITTALAVK